MFLYRSRHISLKLKMRPPLLASPEWHISMERPLAKKLLLLLLPVRQCCCRLVWATKFQLAEVKLDYFGEF